MSAAPARTVHLKVLPRWAVLEGAGRRVHVLLPQAASVTKRKRVERVAVLKLLFVFFEDSKIVTREKWQK